MNELMLYGFIGLEGQNTPLAVRQKLSSMNRAKEIVVRLHSDGGNTGDGLAIYNMLKSHSARIVVEVEGSAISAGSLVAMAGDEIRMPASAEMMIHSPWSFARGDAKEMQRVANMLEAWQKPVAEIYAGRSRNTVDAVNGMMAAETWMTGSEAVERGFADTVVDYSRDFSFSAYTLNYRNVPARVAERVNAPNRQQASIETERLRQCIESIDSRRASIAR